MRLHLWKGSHALHHITLLHQGDSDCLSTNAKLMENDLVPISILLLLLLCLQDMRIRFRVTNEDNNSIPFTICTLAKIRDGVILADSEQSVAHSCRESLGVGIPRPAPLLGTTSIDILLPLALLLTRVLEITVVPVLVILPSDGVK